MVHPQKRRMPSTFLWRPPLVVGYVLNLKGRRSCFERFGRIVCCEPLDFCGQGLVAAREWSQDRPSHWKKIRFPSLAGWFHMARPGSRGTAKPRHGLGKIIIVHKVNFAAPYHDLQFFIHE
jgi:hypothetical protein